MSIEKAQHPESVDEAPIETPEIIELREPIKKMLAEMADNIEKGKYRLIIGDDASGRAPALIFHKIISAIYKDKGYNPPQTIFLAGAYRYSPKKLEDMSEIIRRAFEKAGGEKEALVVTDTVKEGRRALGIAQALRTNKADFDIATIGLFNPEALKGLQETIGGKIYYGMAGTPSIYQNRNISGVIKGDDDFYEIFARPYREYGSPEMEVDDFNPQEFAKIRGEIDNLSQELIEWYRRYISAKMPA